MPPSNNSLFNKKTMEVFRIDEKSTNLMKEVIDRFSNQGYLNNLLSGDIVMDLFAGSASCLNAALSLGNLVVKLTKIFMKVH